MPAFGVPGEQNRFGPSAIIEIWAQDASQKLEEYYKTRPIAFYPWLRSFALERLVWAYRRHMVAQRRSVRREQTLDVLLSDESAAVLADQFLAGDTTPSSGSPVPSGVTTVSYAHGQDLISQSRDGARLFYHVDGLGSTRALTDATGAVMNRYLYDAFGFISGLK